MRLKQSTTRTPTAHPSFSRDIKMAFGIEKCKTLNIAKGTIEMGNFATEDDNAMETMNEDGIRGSFQKFCTLYVFCLKVNLFYKIHLQVFNVISIVLYHSGPTFG
jgi:uncharacterized protein (DUF849 family)